METLDKILYLLHKQNKKQKDLTDFIGLTKNTFTNWKLGTSQSYKKHIDKIAEFFGVSADYLLGIEEQTIKKPLSEEEKRFNEAYEIFKTLDADELMQFKGFVAGMRANRKPD